MDSTFATYLDRVRAHRAELHESVAAVGTALGAPVTRGGAWRERVRAALAELSHDFDAHIDLTEAPGGLYDNVRAGDLRLAAAVDRLTSEHVLYRDTIGSYLTVIEHGGTLADLPAFREELKQLVDGLVRHRKRGRDLVYEAFQVDLGGSD